MTKKLYEYKLNKENPFLNETLYHVEKGKKSVLFGNKEGDYIMDKEGEAVGHSVFVKRIDVDKAQFAKIYINNLASWFELSKTGIRIFAYILNNLKPNNDNFIFSYESCMEYTGYKTRKSIADGIRELIENDFIARGINQYIYFINPTIFFNGDRITFLNHYRIREQKKEQKIDEQKKIEK